MDPFLALFRRWLARFCGSFLLISLLGACSQPDSPAPDSRNQLGLVSLPEPVSLDLPQIQSRDTLRAILTYSASSYFIYKGQTMGYEYELVRRLADSMGLELKIIVARDMDKMTDMLLKGEGDLIAHGLTVTRERQKYLTFTDPLTQTQQMLVQRKPENWRSMKLHEIDNLLVRNPIDLIDKAVSVRAASAYHERLLNLMEEVGGDILIDTVPGIMTTDEIISQVARGDIQYTIADRNIALLNAAFYPDLDIETPISFRQRLAWAVRPNSPELLASINGWLASMKQETDFYVIYNKYFKNKKNYRMRASSEYYSKTGGKISPYDEDLQQLAASLDWDWRLLAAQVYQESQFDPTTCSWMGACGLMQLIPATASRYGIEDRNDPNQNLRGGTRYLASLQEIWSEIPDSTEKIKFILASYNAGPGHVQDAVRLAEKHGKDPMIWTANVDEFILKKANPEFYNDPLVKFGYCRGSEPYNYVNDILIRYDTYRQHIQ